MRLPLPTGGYLPWPEVARVATVYIPAVLLPVMFLYRRAGAARTIAYSLGLSTCVAAAFSVAAPYVSLEVQTVRGPMAKINLSLWATIFLSALGTLVCRIRLGRCVIQDGTICQGCGYCVIGSINQTCSECGREFTFQELGTTREAFYAKGLSGGCSVVSQGDPQPAGRPVVTPRSAGDDG